MVSIMMLILNLVAHPEMFLTYPLLVFVYCFPNTIKLVLVIFNHNLFSANQLYKFISSAKFLLFYSWLSICYTKNTSDRGNEHEVCS